MSKNALRSIFACIALTCLSGCGEDDSISCTTCNAPQTVAFELCRDADGKALVNGEETGTDYDQYLDDLEASGASCGGN